MKTLREAIKEHTLNALNSVGGNKTKAAQILGVSRRSMHRLINRYKLSESIRYESQDDIQPLFQKAS